MSLSFPFESLFMHSPIASCLLSPGREAKILTANVAYLEVTGRTREELIGVSLFEAFPGNPEDDADTGVQALRKTMDEVLDTEQPHKMPLQRYPIAVTHPNGSTAFEERYWSAEITPIFNEDGKQVFIMLTIADVSERVRSDVALKESEGRMRAFMTASADVVYRMSPDWRFMHGLDGRGFLKTTASWDEYRIEEYVHAADVELARNAIATAIRTKSVFELEHRVIRVDGTEGWTYSKAVPLLDETGDIREWVGAASDITERKRVELKLKEADRRKDDFLAMLAHELRNPLAPISSAVELLPRLTNNPDQVFSISQVITRQVRHLTMLVDDLLDVARVTKGMVEIESNVVNIAEVLTDASEQVLPHFQSRRQVLTWDASAAPLYVRGDHKRLVQVLTNLLNNSSKYTPESQTISAKIWKVNQEVRIEVQDTGIGIEEEFLPHVFDLFVQSKRSLARSEGGLGLGLSLVKSLVELHGGWVTAESAGPNLGSRFTISLPLENDNGETLASPATSQSSCEIPKAIRFLVVDDNVDAAEVTAAYIEAVRYSAHTVNDAQAAIALAEHTYFDACLLDIGLPGDMNGYDLARKLRGMPNTVGSLLIAVTGYGTAEDKAKGAAAGFDHYFVKPVKIQQIIELVQNL